MSDDLKRRSLLTAGLALAATPVVAGATATAAEAEGPVLIGPARGDQLHVMAFNIRYDNDPSPRSWPERRPLIAKLLRDERPTILGTQEGLFHQDKQIRQDLPVHYDWIHLHREGGSRGEAMTIYFDSHRLEVMAYDHYWLSDTPMVMGSKTWGNNVTRMVTWVRFLDLRTGKTFVHLNTHFDHQVEVARQKSALMIRDTIATFDVPTIVTGDFNTAAETTVSYDTLVTNGPLKDSWNVAKSRLTPTYGTFNFWNPVPVENGPRIDWILTPPSATVLKAAINVSSTNGQTPSDHWPVQALVRLA